MGLFNYSIHFGTESAQLRLDLGQSDDKLGIKSLQISVSQTWARTKPQRAKVVNCPV